MEIRLKKGRRRTSITDLHESITIHIFFFLSVKSIFRCKSVCKTWATLVSQLPYFAKLYTTTRPPLHLLPIQFLLNGTHCSNHQHLLLTEFDPHTSSSHNDSPVPITKSFLPNIFDPHSSPHQLEICSTCSFTGFVMAYAFTFDSEYGLPYHLFNPVTAQHIVVQQQTTRTISWRGCALVFASKTNQLKLLKFIYESLHVEIQTIGTGLWRTIGKTQRSYYPTFNYGFPVFFNGVYHWFCDWYCGSSAICIFNADDEVFDEFLTPSCTQDYVSSNIGLLDDSLCICMKHGKAFHFWVMEKYGVPDSWTQKFVISNNTLGFNAHRIFEPLRYLGNGEILILCHDDDVVSYNLNTKSCKVIKKYYGKSFLRYETIPYVPCFSKLCGLDGEVL